LISNRPFQIIYAKYFPEIYQETKILHVSPRSVKPSDIGGYIPALDEYLAIISNRDGIQTLFTE
jgi:hypothetical protein